MTAADRTAPNIAVTYRPTGSLTLDPTNPRRHDRRQVRQIARSIEAFGFNVPILIDANGTVIAGHGRLLASRELGLAAVPTIELDHLNKAQMRAFMIADNRLTEASEWDERLLAEQLKELAEISLDFSLETTGFTMGEIDLRIEGLARPQDEEDPADIVPAREGPAVTRIGDLWLLGRHRILCGDALNAASYATLMEGEQAAMVFTDPPYNLRVDEISGLGAIRHREFPMASGEMDASAFTSFLTTVLTLLARHSVDGSLHFHCMDWRHMPEILTAGRVYSELKNVCVWAKSTAGMGSLYRSQHELVFLFKSGKAPHRNNVQLGQYGRHRSNVWNYPSPSAFGRRGEEGKLLALHPTVKPVALVADAIMDCSLRGEVVLDAFLGSGTTTIAAEKTGRRCYGLELDPGYVDTIVRRWQDFTRDVARHAVSGLSFNEIAAGGHP